jgi:hypothetical protein
MTLEWADESGGVAERVQYLISTHPGAGAPR